jgi:hypothetical protein
VSLLKRSLFSSLAQGKSDTVSLLKRPKKQRQDLDIGSLNSIPPVPCVRARFKGTGL